MIKDKFKIIFFQLFPSLLILGCIVMFWEDLTFTTIKQSIICFGLVLARLDNTMTLKAIIQKEINFETSATIVLLVGYFIDIEQNSDINDGFIGEFFSILYYSVLIFNLAVYVLILLLLTLFIMMIIILYLKGDQITELQINLCKYFNLKEGLTPSELSKLQTNNFAFFRDLQSDPNNIPKECLQILIIGSICLVDFEPSDDVHLLPKCKHIFHKECIKQWFDKQIKCPNCRANIREDLQD